MLLVGPDAEALGRAQGLEVEDPDWFVVQRERAPAGEHGTVGAVALDAGGRLAAATSTGGVRGQLPGRVGDTPQIGSGTFADDNVAVSCTGTGEQFIRRVAAHEVAALVHHAGLPLAEAAARAVAGLDGGLIALGRDGSAKGTSTTSSPAPTAPPSLSGLSPTISVRRGSAPRAL